MTKKIRVEATIVSSAIYPLLVNSPTYPLWSMIQYYESLRPSGTGLDGEGVRRLFRTNRFTITREEVTNIVPNERFDYTLLSGFPLIVYRASTTLGSVPSGTRITWGSSFAPKYALTGFFRKALMGWVFRSMVQSLAEAAEDPGCRRQMLELAQGDTMAKSAMRRTA
jgi:hypothetical protein